MPQTKLTKTVVEKAVRDAESLSRAYAKELAAKALAKGKARDPDAPLPDILYFDTEVKGFGLRVTAAGKPTFIVQGRVGAPDTAAVRITIGNFGTFTVDQARDEAREHLRAMRKGIDPRASKKADAAQKVTLQEVCDAYVARPGKLKPSSKAAIERHVATTFEDWSAKPIAAINEDMCKARYRRMLTKGLRGKKGAPGQANQAFAVLGALMAYAGRQYRHADGSPICDRSPVDALKDDRVRLKPRTTRILDHKVGAVWLALRQWRAETVNRDTMSSIDLVRLLLATGLRISEASGLQWSQVNLEAGYFNLPNPKNANPVSLPLSSQMVEMLRARPRVAGNPHVFPSWAGHLKDPRDIMKKVSKVAGSHLTPHDLRRTFTNIALRSCRIEKFRTDLLTNHITRDVTAEHYFDTTNLQWLAPEAQQVGDWLDQQAVIAASANAERLPERAEAA